MLQNLAGFLLDQEVRFFLVPSLTCGIMINYCVLSSRAATSGDSWRRDNWVLAILTYCSLSVESPHIPRLVYRLSFLGIPAAVFGDEEISPAVR